MKVSDPGLVTPIYVKTRPDMPWPDDRVFYLLAADGLYLCRNNEFMRSSVRVSNGPSELADHQSGLALTYPKLPRRLLEKIVGFAARIGRLYGSEAGVLLAWDRERRRYRVIVPEQEATVSRGWFGDIYPIGLHYEVPAELPPGWVLVGDVHSHVNEGAYSSGTDKEDETHRAGLHVVVGRLNREPPEFHVEAVVDGTRFRVPEPVVFAGYRKRRLAVPQEWIDKVKVEMPKPYYSGDYEDRKRRHGHGTGYYGSYGGYGSSYNGGYGLGYRREDRDRPPKKDEERGQSEGEGPAPPEPPPPDAPGKETEA
jgi:PRTRC genetic system protein A